MLADTPDELHEMAQALGLKREWFQAAASWPHYDVSEAFRSRAIRLGAVPVTGRQMAEKTMYWRKCLLGAMAVLRMLETVKLLPGR